MAGLKPATGAATAGTPCLASRPPKRMVLPPVWDLPEPGSMNGLSRLPPKVTGWLDGVLKAKVGQWFVAEPMRSTKEPYKSSSEGL